MLELGKKLYDKLPNVYKYMDNFQKPTAYPLKRLFDVLDEGFADIESNIIDMSNIYDLDICLDEFLPLLQELLGIKIPYYMTPTELRAFLKVVPKLYKYKGTVASFMFLARSIFGNDVRITVSKPTYIEGMIPEEYRKINISLRALSDDFQVGDRSLKFKAIAEMLRPVNRELVVTLITVEYVEDAAVMNRLAELYFADSIVENDSTLYNYSGIAEVSASTAIKRLNSLARLCSKSTRLVTSLRTFSLFIAVEAETPAIPL